MKTLITTLVLATLVAAPAVTTPVFAADDVTMGNRVIGPTPTPTCGCSCAATTAARVTERSRWLGAAGTSVRPLPPIDGSIQSHEHQGAAMTMSAILYLPAVLAGALVLLAIAYTRAEPETETVRPVKVAQFCLPQEPSADTHRLFCRHTEG